MRIASQIQHDEFEVDDFELETGRKRSLRKPLIFAAAGAAFIVLILFFANMASQQSEAAQQLIGKQNASPAGQETQAQPAQPGSQAKTTCGDGFCSSGETCATCLQDCSCGTLACNLQSERCEGINIDPLMGSLFPGSRYTVLYFTTYNSKAYYTVEVNGQVKTVSQDGIEPPK